MAGERDILHQLVGFATKGFDGAVSVVDPNFICLRQVEGLARISAEPGDRPDVFARAQVDDFDGSLVLSGNEQALALRIHGHMIEVTLDTGQRNRLQQPQRCVRLAWRAILGRRGRSGYRAQSPENHEEGRLHSRIPPIAVSFCKKHGTSLKNKSHINICSGSLGLLPQHSPTYLMRIGYTTNYNVGDTNVRGTRELRYFGP